MDRIREKVNMAEETKTPTEQYLTDFKGGPSEVVKAKAEYIKKWGYASFEQLVLRSRKSVQR
jgi:hypothetical protein